MKFVDQAIIQVQAGKGGHGCLSFRREKFIPLGGPDGGDGGEGGSIYLVADAHVNTLVDFRFQRHLKAQNGQPGSGKNRTGKSGDDLIVPVPLGTLVHDAHTGELIGDLTQPDQRICVARGGERGLGNARFKSSVNRAPRETTLGGAGELRDLRLELRLLADVGLLGLPNAGKSTLIRVVSNATPKVADYPFTTLHPNLGVVRIEAYRSFVMADIPGLIEGASQGAGLGVQFLKHLGRTRVLLHLVDIAPIDGSDPVAAFQTIEAELKQYSETLYEKPRWLVFSKVDLLSSEEAERRMQAITQAIDWKGPIYAISSQSKLGLQTLCQDLMTYLDTLNAEADSDADEQA